MKKVSCFRDLIIIPYLHYEKNKNNDLPSAKENTIGVNMMVKMQEHRLQWESVISNLLSPNKNLVNLNNGLGKQHKVSFRSFRLPIKYM